MRPFLTPSVLHLHPKPQSFVDRSTTVSAIFPLASASIDVSSAINHTQLPIAPTSVVDLANIPDAPLNFPLSVSTSVNLPRLESLLNGYPSALFDFLITGFSIGFRIGFLGQVSSGRDKNNTSEYNTIP